MMALMFHYLRSRQAASAEKIAGSGGRTRYSITRTMLRRVLMNKDLNLVHSSRLPVPEVDIILHLLPVQVDLYSVTFAFVACAVRRAHLRDFYNSEECTSVVRRYELTYYPSASALVTNNHDILQITPELEQVLLSEGHFEAQ